MKFLISDESWLERILPSNQITAKETVFINGNLYREISSVIVNGKESLLGGVLVEDRVLIPDEEEISGYKPGAFEYSLNWRNELYIINCSVFKDRVQIAFLTNNDDFINDDLVYSDYVDKNLEKLITTRIHHLSHNDHDDVEKFLEEVKCLGKSSQARSKK